LFAPPLALPLTKQTSRLELLQELQWSFICSIQHSELTLKMSAGKNLLIIAPFIGYNGVHETPATVHAADAIDFGRGLCCRLLDMG
jgi:hypothetical protein